MIKKLKKVIILFRDLHYYSSGKVKKYYAGEEKTYLRKFRELLIFYVTQKEFFKLYYVAGFNLKGKDCKEFIGKIKIFDLKEQIDFFIKKQYNLNFNYDVVTKDKFYANSILKANNIPCIENLAFIRNNDIFTCDGKIMSLDGFHELGTNLVLKNPVIEASEGILFVKYINNEYFINKKKYPFDKLKNILRNGLWVVQEQKSAHPDIQKINSSSLNVLRIVTMLSDFEPIFLGGFQAFAIEDAETDSWSEGSIFVGFDLENEALDRYGFHSPWYKGDGMIAHHPNSGVRFENYKIPFLKEAVEICKKAHKLFYTNFLLGWDVAITENGPLVVEINEKPGMNVMQCINNNTSSILRTNSRKYFRK
jgi:hypothetical protein